MNLIEMTTFDTFLRTSKFFTIFYGDQISEKEFYAKKFQVSINDDRAIFKMDLMQLLDCTSMPKHALEFDTFSLEDALLTSKIKMFLKSNEDLKYFKLLINGTYEYRISRIKFEKGRCVFFSLN
jgi:hypothetical protein